MSNPGQSQPVIDTGEADFDAVSPLGSSSFLLGRFSPPSFLVPVSDTDDEKPLESSAACADDRTMDTEDFRAMMAPLEEHLRQEEVGEKAERLQSADTDGEDKAERPWSADTGYHGDTDSTDGHHEHSPMALESSLEPMTEEMSVVCAPPSEGSLVPKEPQSSSILNATFDRQRPLVNTTFNPSDPEEARTSTPKRAPPKSIAPPLLPKSIVPPKPRALKGPLKKESMMAQIKARKEVDLRSPKQKPGESKGAAGIKKEGTGAPAGRRSVCVSGQPRPSSSTSSAVPAAGLKRTESKEPGKGRSRLSSQSGLRKPKPAKSTAALPKAEKPEEASTKASRKGPPSKRQSAVPVAKPPPKTSDKIVLARGSQPPSVRSVSRAGDANGARKPEVFLGRLACLGFDALAVTAQHLNQKLESLKTQTVEDRKKASEALRHQQLQLEQCRRAVDELGKKHQEELRTARQQFESERKELEKKLSMSPARGSSSQLQLVNDRDSYKQMNELLQQQLKAQLQTVTKLSSDLEVLPSLYSQIRKLTQKNDDQRAQLEQKQTTEKALKQQCQDMRQCLRELLQRSDKKEKQAESLLMSKEQLQYKLVTSSAPRCHRSRFRSSLSESVDVWSSPPAVSQQLQKAAFRGERASLEPTRPGPLHWDSMPNSVRRDSVGPCTVP